MIAQILAAGPLQGGPAVTPHAGAASTAWLLTVLLSVASGVLVAVILAAARVSWSRRVPKALSQAVRRQAAGGGRACT
jgi:hypothetical protein